MRTDLLMLVRGVAGFMRLLLSGGVAGALARHARYPVVIVPGSD